MIRPLNFLHLTTFYPPYSFGGDAMYIYRLAHALGDSGHGVDVVHCTDAYRLLHPGEPEIQFPSHPNVSVHSLSSPYGRLSPLITQQTGYTGLKRRTILKILNSKPYDVIHFHNMSLIGAEALKFEPAGTQAVKL
ncbi:MAG: glycosyltransferase, partial [Candidatus Binatia bacterium]